MRPLNASGANVWSILGDAARQKKGLIGKIVLALLLLSLAQGLLLLLIGPLFKAIFGAAAASSLTLGSLLSKPVAEKLPELAAISVDRSRITQLLPLSIFLVSLIQGAAGYLYQYNQQAFILFLGNRFRDRLFAAIIRQPFAKLQSRSAGEWMSMLMNDVTYLQSRLSDLVTGLVKDSCQVIALLGSLYFIQWQVALCINILVIPIMIGTGRTGKRIARYTEGWQKALARMAGAVLDLRRRFEFIRAQKGEAFEQARFRALNQSYYDMIRRTILTRSAFAPSLEFAGALVFALVLVAVGRGWSTFQFGPGELFQFLTALGVMQRPLKGIGEQLSRYHETKGILRRSTETLNAVESEQDQQASELAPSQRSAAFAIQAFGIDYGGAFRLKADHLRVERGQCIAIIGPSGGGKSTLLKCLAGLYPPTHWEADRNWDELRRSATLVSQSPFLFSGSIRDNLCYGLGREAPTDAAIEDALRFVGLSSELAAKGQTINTELDFLQSPLSGGQMQRLTIARGLLRPHPLLLMDEVTSAIDAAAEEQLTRGILQRTKNESRTLLYVTHRLSQLELFDQLWFCEGGRVQIFKDAKEWQKSDRVQRFLDEQN